MSDYSLKCANCGASGLVPQGRSLMKCSYCKTVVLVEGAPIQAAEDLKGNLAATTRKIETLLRKGANYLHDGISDGGFLHITRSELVFIPHALNVNSGYRLVFPYTDLRNISKLNRYVVSRQLVLSLADGTEAAFVVWGRDKVIDAVRKQL